MKQRKVGGARVNFLLGQRKTEIVYCNQKFQVLGSNKVRGILSVSFNRQFIVMILPFCIRFSFSY